MGVVSSSKTLFCFILFSSNVNLFRPARIFPPSCTFLLQYMSSTTQSPNISTLLSGHALVSWMSQYPSQYTEAPLVRDITTSTGLPPTLFFRCTICYICTATFLCPLDTEDEIPRISKCRVVLA